MKTQSKPYTKKPKRPLTPYNLFYRFKRGRILQAFRGGDDNRDDVVMKLIAAAPGLEDLTTSQLKAISPKDAYAISRGVIREELQATCCRSKARDPIARRTVP